MWDHLLIKKVPHLLWQKYKKCCVANKAQDTNSSHKKSSTHILYFIEKVHGKSLFTTVTLSIWYVLAFELTNCRINNRKWQISSVNVQEMKLLN